MNSDLIQFWLFEAELAARLFADDILHEMKIRPRNNIFVRMIRYYYAITVKYRCF